MSEFIYLASQSPRRRELLAQLGIAHRLLLPRPDEDAEALEAVLPGEAAADYVSRVCLAKAQAALRRFADLRSGNLPAAPILSADTTVSIDGKILGKPEDADDARRMLGALSGNWHEVLTAVAVTPAAATRAPADHAAHHFALSISRVRMGVLDAARIDRYISSGEPFGKAGAYGIQGRAAAFISAVEGSYSGIMGLPLFETVELLQAAGMTVS